MIVDWLWLIRNHVLGEIFEVTREEKRYIFPSLLSSNQDFANYEFFANKLIIGIISENFIIYNAENKNYAIIDTINLHTLEEFSSFDTLFNSINLRYTSFEVHINIQKYFVILTIITLN